MASATGAARLESLQNLLQLPVLLGCLHNSTSETAKQVGPGLND